MTGPSEAQLRKLWGAGVPVSQAWLTCGEPALQAQWKALEKQSAVDAMREAGETFLPQEMPALERLQKVLEPANIILLARGALKKKMQAAILTHIGSGRLLGYGFEPPRKLASVPVMLSKGIWAGKIDWDKSAVSGAGLSFIEVRLTTRRNWRATTKSQQALFNVPKPARPGRPTVGPDIEEAFHALHKAGEIDSNSSASSHYGKVRAWLASNKPTLPANAHSLGHEVIRKNFMPLFKALKKNHKL